MLKLSVKQQNGSGPVMDIRWCLSKDDMEKLASIDSVQVFIVVRYEGGMEEREMRPLKELQTQMALHFPGKHRMFARLMHVPPRFLKNTKNNLLSKKYPHTYRTPVLDYDGENLNTDFKEVDPLGDSQCVLNIEVDKEYFAPEPSPWVKRWCNLWFRYKSPDQCAFRKRKILAFSIQPIVVGLWIVLLMSRNLLLWIWAQLLLGFRGINPRLLLHPWTTEKDDFFPGKGSWFIQKDRVWPMFLCPLIYLAFAVLVFLIHTGNPDYSWLHALFMAILYVVIGIVGLVILAVISWLGETGKLERFVNWADEWLDGVLDRRARVGVQNPDYLSEIQDALVCSTVSNIPNPTALSSLPKQARTVRLRFLHMKAKMCKPFAG